MTLYKHSSQNYVTAFLMIHIYLKVKCGVMVVFYMHYDELYFSGAFLFLYVFFYFDLFACQIPQIRITVAKSNS